MGKSSAMRLVPRTDDSAKVSNAKSSADIRADLDALAAERQAAVEAVERLEATRNGILLLDDDAQAEAHDAEMARQRRAIERCDLKRPGMETALAEAEAREDAERREAARVEAEAAVQAVLADVDACYAKPAKKIAEFMARLERAEALARAAGVETIHHRHRFKPGFTEPDRTEPRVRFLDERGNVTDSRYGPMAATYAGLDAEGYRLNESGHRYPERRRTTVHETIPGREHAPVHAEYLAYAVRLPGFSLGDPDFWREHRSSEPAPASGKYLL